MRCRQADQRLNDYRWDQALINADSDLSDHLKNCDSCAQSLHAAENLQDSLAVLRDNREQFANENKETPLAFLRTRVEVNTASRKDQSVMSGIIKQLQTSSKSGKLGLSAVVAVAALAVFTLIPFSYDKTVGYEVAFAGVDKNLALNTEELRIMLAKLGMPNTTIDVSDCEATCRVKFSQLSSSDDVRLLVAAFSEFDNIELDGDVKRVVFRTEGTLVQKIKEGHIFSVLTSEKSDSELHEIIIKSLGEDFHETINLWISESYGADAPEGELVLGSVILSRVGSFFVEGDSVAGEWVQCFGAANGDSIHVTDSVGCLMFGSLNFSEGGLTEERIQQLRDDGYEVIVTESEDGAKQIMLKKFVEGGSSGEIELYEEILLISDNSDNSDSEAESQGESLGKELGATLPDGYQLSQNYPNPFNPSTKIDFTVPSSQHVTVEVINLMGQTVRTLLDQTVSAGLNTVEWDATDDSGQRVSSGVYFYRLKVGNAVQTKKMILLK